MRALVQLLEYESIGYNWQMEVTDALGIIITDRRIKPEHYTLYSERVRNLGKKPEPEKSGREVLNGTKDRIKDMLKERFR